jgi:hypothetical protein
MQCVAATFTSRRLGRAGIAVLTAALGLMSFAATGRSQPAPEHFPPPWVELVGPQPSVRVVIKEGAACPTTLRADGEDIAMQVRADSKPLFPGDPKSPPKKKLAEFRVTVCEALLKQGTRSATLDGTPLPVPHAEINRIVVIGDTGCRIKEGKKPKVQNCQTAWPYGDLAKLASNPPPDLVIHVGDYLYREKCQTDCGYGWNIWQEDFFDPSTPLLKAAPWIMVRGNHEICGPRAAEGWVRFLDGPAPGQHCPVVGDAVVVDLGDLKFAVMDTAIVPGKEDDDNDAPRPAAAGDGSRLKKVLEKYDAIEKTIPDNANAWLVTHVPFNGIRAKGAGSMFDNAVLQNGLGKRLSPGIKMIVSGHIHLFEGLQFTDGRRPQLVVGSAGTELAPWGPQQSTSGLPVDAKRSVVLKKFGYMTWDRDTTGGAAGIAWKGTLYDTAGKELVRCSFKDGALTCQKV